MLGYYNYTVILTYVGMIFGFTAITFTVSGKFALAILFLMISGICDMFDGTIAATKVRNADEKSFGIQIDSMSDLICFGMFPALLIYNMNRGSKLVLAVSAFYLLCTLIRLSFFNVDEANRQAKCSGSREIYQGLPVTSAALTMPAMYEVGHFLSIDAGKLGAVVLVCMGIAFLSPIKLKKPHMTGKIIIILAGLIEFALLIRLMTGAK